MNTLIRTEFLKLRTVRSPWIILGAAPLLVAVGISGLVSSSGIDARNPAVKQSDALAHVGLASLVTLLFGIVAMAGEYRHRTITDTYLTTPARGRVVGAKLVLCAAAGAVSGLISAAIGLAAAAIWWSAKGFPFAWSDGEMWRTVGGGIAWQAAFAAIGVGVGALLRNLVGAIAGALAWIALVEGLVGQLVGNFARWLPFSAGQALGAGANSSQHLLPRWGGGVVLAVYAVAFAVAAMSVSVRRDVA
ncbi:MAG TPA: ABC transporter permease [Actinocrinis sp.]